jgi:hypothetical protein
MCASAVISAARAMSAISSSVFRAAHLVGDVREVGQVYGRDDGASRESRNS